MSSPAPVWPCSIAVDVGGTFTDLVMIDGRGALTVAKVPSVPADPSQGVLNAVGQAAADLGLEVAEILANCARFVHGSTVATNAVLEHKLDRVGLITTAGFRDALEIRRGIRRDQWNHREPWPEVMVPRYLRLGVGGRVDRHGTEVEPLNTADVDRALATFADHDVAAVAVCLLHSYQNPSHEQQVATMARSAWPGELTVVSSELAPLLGEYERTSTTVINAGLVPKVGGYLQRLDAALQGRGLTRPLLLMQSNGGTVPLSALAARPVDLMLSGPAAVGGALRRSIRAVTGRREHEPMVSMEIGGTSCDVAVMTDGQVSVIDGLEVGGYHMNIPAVDVHTVGAGGGTLAGVDQAGMLTVGPQGAGADPGPACYGRGGTRPTATDAHLVLGRLRPGRSAGGAIELDGPLGTRAVGAHVGDPLRLSPPDAAIGVITVLEQHLRQAVETITIERGRDPGRMTLVAAGGAGGLHGSPVARALGCRTLIIPAEAGVFCAIGMLHSNLRRDVSRSLVLPFDDATGPTVLDALRAEQDRTDKLVAAEWPADVPVGHRWYLDLRYPGQLWSVRVELGAPGDVLATADPSGADLSVADARRAFEEEYERLYGHIQPDGRLELTAVGVVAEGTLADSPTISIAAADSADPPVLERRRCWLGPEAGWDEVPVYDGRTLAAGHRLEGPYLVEAATTTVLGLPGDRLSVQSNGDLEVRLP